MEPEEKEQLTKSIRSKIQKALNEAETPKPDLIDFYSPNYPDPEKEGTASVSSTDEESLRFRLNQFSRYLNEGEFEEDMGEKKTDYGYIVVSFNFVGQDEDEYPSFGEVLKRARRMGAVNESRNELGVTYDNKAVLP